MFPPFQNNTACILHDNNYHQLTIKRNYYLAQFWTINPYPLPSAVMVLDGCFCLGIGYLLTVTPNNRYLPGYLGEQAGEHRLPSSRGRGQGTLVFFGPLFLTGTMKGIKATRTSLTRGGPKISHTILYIDMTWETYWDMYREQTNILKWT